MTVHANEHYVVIESQSAYGTHTMNRPTRAWQGTPWLSAGQYTAWDETTLVPGATMIKDFIDLLLPFFMPTYTFLGYTIYSTLVPGDDPVPVWAENLTGKVGTSVSESQDRAWGRTYTFRTTGSQLAKIVLLDTPCEGNAVKIKNLTGDSASLALVAAFMSDAKAWSGRADQKPAMFLSLVTDTNEALLRKYGVS